MNRILIIDGEQTYLDNLSLILQRRDYEIETAFNSQQALDSARQFKPDLVIMDWLLPDKLDPPEILDALREVNPHLLVILTTGLPREDIESQLHAQQPAAVLEKPFELHELVQAVEQAQ